MGQRWIQPLVYTGKWPLAPECCRPNAICVRFSKPSCIVSVRGKPLGRTAMAALLRAVVAHGFRSSFRDWAAEETDHPWEVVEAA